MNWMRPMHANRSHARRFCTLFLLLVHRCSIPVAADDEAGAATTSALTEAPVSGEGLQSAGADGADAAILAFFFFLCAAVLSVFGVLLAYFSLQEDKLMRAYQWHGVKVKAQVWSADFARVRPTAACSSCSCDASSPSPNDEGRAEEYTAVIDYRVVHNDDKVTNEDCTAGGPAADGYRVRKQVRACGSDFVWSKPPAYTAVEDPKSQVVRLEFHDACPAPTGIKLPYCEEASFVPLELEVLVLPEYKHSALPAKHVQRVCSLSYRLPTALMLLCNFVFVLMCVALGWMSIFSARYDAADPSSSLSSSSSTQMFALLWYYSCVVFLGFVFLAMIVTHCFLAKSIQDLLKSEYLEGGDAVLPEDSYSIASGDDSYLRL